MELQQSRQSTGMGGFNPLTYTEIDAWARLSDREVSPWELGLLKQLDMLFLTNQSKKNNTRNVKDK